MLAFKNILGLGALLFFISCSSVSTETKTALKEDSKEKSEDSKEQTHSQMQFTRSYYDRF